MKKLILYTVTFLGGRGGRRRGRAARLVLQLTRLECAERFNVVEDHRFRPSGLPCE